MPVLRPLLFLLILLAGTTIILTILLLATWLGLPAGPAP